MVAGDPVESDGAVVFGSDTFPLVLDVWERPEERGEYGLHVAVPTNYWERTIRTAQCLETWKECVKCTARDL